MSVGNYYFDTATFANATALFTDTGLTQLAPNGFYSDNIIVKEQLNGTLKSSQQCNCGSSPTPTPTGTPTPTATNIPTPIPTNFPTPTPTVSPIPSLPPTPTPTPTPFPSPTPAGYYYPLTPCSSCFYDTIRYIWSMTEPTNNQQYLDGFTTCYYTYQPSVTYPPLISIDESLAFNPNPQEIEGTFGCPDLPSDPNVPIPYQVRECATYIEYLYYSNDTYDINTRLVNPTTGNTYTVRAAIPYATQPLVVDLLCVDSNGNLEGSPNFSTCTINCPGISLFLLADCSNFKSQSLSLQSSNVLELQGISINSYVYSNITQKCYYVAGYRIFTNTIYTGGTRVDLDGAIKMDSCSQCTNSYSSTSNI